MNTVVLAIDIGNTNMEFGICHEGKVQASFRMGTNREVTSDEVGLMLMQFFAFNKVDKEDIEDVIITSVVPQVMYSINNAIKKYVEKNTLVAGVNLPISMENRYGNPAEVGADRLVSGFSAYRKYGGPVIVVDFGTATTFDAIDGGGAYLGGAIHPGIKISMEALFAKTAKLPRVELVNPGSVIGRTTVSSMQSGVLFGYVGSVEYIVRKMKKELGGQAKVVATGGLAQMISGHTPVIDLVDRSIILDGLLMMYQDYKDKA